MNMKIESKQAQNNYLSRPPHPLIQSPSPIYTVILEASQIYYDRVSFTTCEEGGGRGEEEVRRD